MRDKVIKSIKDADISELKMPIVAIYNSPDDYPGKCVGRIMDLDKPTDTVIMGESITELIMDVRYNTDMAFIPRGAEDVPALVGILM